ncbi:MAG: VanZ family protein [Clostridia bacterium]|nr:VanZ family protein [Clostridia bacterium]
MKKAAAWALCAVWMGVIFAMSAMPGDVSGAQSGMITRLIEGVLLLLPGGADIPQDIVHLIVRKGAHMAEYAVLFALYRRALRLSGARRPGMTALVLCAAYAATDEMHQGFVAGRGPSPVDVAIDTAGAAAMWAVMAGWEGICREKPTRLQ